MTARVLLDVVRAGSWCPASANARIGFSERRGP